MIAVVLKASGVVNTVVLVVCEGDCGVCGVDVMVNAAAEYV